MFLQSQLDNYQNGTPARAGGGCGALDWGNGELVMCQLFSVLAFKGLGEAEDPARSSSRLDAPQNLGDIPG